MYQALYRKYRPKDFDSVVGQEYLKRTLKNSIKNKTFSHAYMFFGPRGTGKTTLSKIFARSINCENPIDGCSCNNCDMCIYSNDKECVDIIEIDAASNNGVDEIRELKNKINLVPSKLKYKVYIIDEVHMLSIGAFNALLKTLEEPPEHIVFILATTDPQKVPETIISRCQCFSFERITEKDIVSRLNYVCEKENIDIEDDVLVEISQSVDGGMRDALSILDKLISYSNSKITLEMYYELNGLITKKDINMLVDKIFSLDYKSFLISFNSYNDAGKNIIQILNQILYFLRDQILLHYIDNSTIPYDVDKIISFINIINEKMFDIKKSGNPLIYIEMIILNFMNNYLNCSVIKSEKVTECQEESSYLNKKTNFNNDIIKENIDFDNKNEYQSNSVIDSKVEDQIIEHDNDHEIEKLSDLLEINKIRVNNTFASASKTYLEEFKNKLNILLDYKFDDNVGYAVCTLLDGNLRAAGENNIIISYQYDSVVKQNLLLESKLSSIFNKLTSSNISFAIITDDEWKNEKQKYIENLKKGVKYSKKEEPIIKNFEEKKDNVIINKAIELFGDIVEIE